MKKTIQFLIKCLLLILIACMLMTYFSIVLRPKYYEAPDDTTNKTEGFYALEKNSLDALFLGSSHSCTTPLTPPFSGKKQGLTVTSSQENVQPFLSDLLLSQASIKHADPTSSLCSMFSAFQTVQKPVRQMEFIKRIPKVCVMKSIVHSL